MSAIPNAAVIPALAAVLQLAMGVVMWGMARAPGWQRGRVFALLAFSCAAYSGVNIITAVPSSPPGLIDASIRANLFLGALHVTLWLRYAFGGDSAAWSAMPPWARAWTVLVIGSSVLLPALGWHKEDGRFVTIEVPSLGFTYTNIVTSPVGDALMALLCLTLLPTAVAFVRLARRGVRGASAQVVAFALFLACAVGEVLVTAGIIQGPFLADIGFLAVMLPVASETVRRVVDDARRLADASARLTGEVRVATAERDRAQGALAEAERQAALGRLAAGVGHEINNPLSYLRLHVDEVRAWSVHASVPTPIEGSLAAIDDGVARITRIVRELRETVRPSVAPFAPVSVELLLSRSRAIAGHHLAAIRHVEVVVPRRLHVLGDESRLVQALVNLLSNAAQAIAEREADGDSVIRVRVGGDDALVTIEITDSGRGMDEAQLARWGEPFATSRAALGGTGLGLFLTRQVVEQHGGRLSVASVPGDGTTVSLALPRAEPLASATDGLALVGATRSAGGPRGVEGVRPSVLIIDDDLQVTTGLARVLEVDADVEVALGGRAGLERLAREPAPDAIVCDLMMPEVSGLDVASALSARGESWLARTLFMTGGATTADAAAFVARPDVQVLYKPVTAGELRAAVRERVRAA
jgi:signal transduction histidine kinase